MILSDKTILVLADSGMITPFQPSQVKSSGHISYGLSSFGYDATAEPEWFIFSGQGSKIVDPLAFDQKAGHWYHQPEIILEPGGYALTCTHEVFTIPHNVMGLVIGKSSYARCGVFINTTPLEPGWTGQITLEIANLSPCPVRIRAGNHGIAQVLFFMGDEVPNVVYDSNRKYQNQSGIVLPKT